MTDNKPLKPLNQDELHALVDGRLPEPERSDAMVRAWSHAHDRETLAAWQAQRESLQALHREVITEPIPATLLEAAQQVSSHSLAYDSWRRWGGMAAGLLLAFGVGWLTHGHIQPGSPQHQSGAEQASVSQFAHQAAVAHAVYSPEVRHPVEVGAAQQDHLVQWLSKRLGKPVRVPQLGALGYELVGGRLLPGESGARAQFMFQNAAGLRITLYLGAIDGYKATDAAEPGHEEAAFRYSTDGPVPAFYWVDQGFGYAISGPVSRTELMQLAELVFQQI